MEIKPHLNSSCLTAKIFTWLSTTRRRAPAVCTSMTTTSSRLFQSGRYYQEINGKRVLLERGDFVFLPMGSYHQMNLVPPVF